MLNQVEVLESPDFLANPSVESSDNNIELESNSNDAYAFVDFLELDFKQDLQDFYSHYILETPDGFIQIFQSMTYGEMIISFLLLVLIVLYALRWIFDVLFR